MLFHNNVVYSCKCVDLKSLCVAEDKLCWALYVDVVCLCDCGNVHDAIFLAATAALRNSKIVYKVSL